ncbi:MAG: hypothetical protein AAF311_06040 [Pseudomonadota bacterium]
MAHLSADSLALTPLAKKGLAVFAAIIAFLLFDRLLTHLSEARVERDRLSAQYVQLLAIQDSPDPTPYFAAARDRMAEFEAGFLGEETDGLNSAKLQTELVRIFSECGAFQPVIDIDTEPLGTVAAITLLESDVRAQADMVTLSGCLDLLNSAGIRINVDSLRWAFPDGVVMRLQAFSKREPGGDT